MKTGVTKRAPFPDTDCYPRNERRKYYQVIEERIITAVQVSKPALVIGSRAREEAPGGETKP